MGKLEKAIGMKTHFAFSQQLKNDFSSHQSVFRPLRVRNNFYGLQMKMDEKLRPTKVRLGDMKHFSPGPVLRSYKSAHLSLDVMYGQLFIPRWSFFCRNGQLFDPTLVRFQLLSRGIQLWSFFLVVVKSFKWFTILACAKLSL